jgi:hypothetical protein
MRKSVNMFNLIKSLNPAMTTSRMVRPSLAVLCAMPLTVVLLLLGGNAFAQGAATKLAYTTVPSVGTVGTAFSVTVQSQDANGNPANLSSDTTITLSKASGSGTLNGTLTGTIASGANNVTISTPIYSPAGTMTLTATASGGVTLTPVTSGYIVFTDPYTIYCRRHPG